MVGVTGEDCTVKASGKGERPTDILSAYVAPFALVPRTSRRNDYGFSVVDEAYVVDALDVRVDMQSICKALNLLAEGK